MKRFLICLFLIFGFLAFNASSVFAQEINIGVYPPIFQANTTPPAQVSAPLDLYNLSDSPLSIDIIIKPFTAAASEDGETSYSFDNPTQSFIGRNVRILDEDKAVTSLDLTAKETRKLKLSINVPKDQSHSDYYFSIIFESKDQSAIGANISRAVGGVATNVLLSVGPKGPTMGNIKEFSVPFFVQKGPVPFTLKVENQSDHYITPTGEILITNLFGQTIGKVDLLPVNILSGTIRAIPDLQSYKDSLSSSNSIFDMKTAFWNEKFLLGPYSAKVTVSLSDSGPVFQRKIYFFAFPLLYLLGIIVVIVIIFIIWGKIRKKVNFPKN